MLEIDWKLVLQNHFDKKVQQTVKHAYRLLRLLTIRVDGKDIGVPRGSLFEFQQPSLLLSLSTSTTP